MGSERQSREDGSTQQPSGGRAAATPGKRSLTDGMVQRRAASPGASDAAVHSAAEAGLEGASVALPHGPEIQAAFGKHDVSDVRAHVGGPAAAAATAMGATAYATGDDVAFGQQPDLHLAAHEAAHVVQQRGGVRLSGGVGQAGDAYERHADAVADRVVAGESAEGLLDELAHRGPAGGPAVQRDIGDDGILGPLPPDEPSESPDPAAVRQAVLENIARLAERADAEATVAELRALAGGHSEIELVTVTLRPSGEGIQIAFGALRPMLPALISSAERRAAELAIDAEGPSFAGLGDSVPATTIEALGALASRYRFGGAGTVAAIQADQEALVRLTAGLAPPLDPVSTASLRLMAATMNQRLGDLVNAGRPSIGPDDGTGVSIESHERAQREFWAAREDIAGGIFGAVFFTAAWLATDGDHEASARWAAAGHDLDELTGMMADAVEAGRDHMEDLERAVPALPDPATLPESATERRGRERATHREHSERMGPGRGRGRRR